jgi:hypothetical protein
MYVLSYAALVVQINLKPVNFPTIQKSEIINIAGISDALKPERFAGGDNFKRCSN